MKIFVLGPAGTNGHEVARTLIARTDSFFGRRQPEVIFCDSNEQVMSEAATNKGHGLIPIENSTGGLVSEVIGWWLNNPENRRVQVIGEYQLPITHDLLVHPTITEVSQLTAVLSHPQALKQCANSLSRLGLNSRLPANSTAGAAEKIAEDEACRTTGVLATKFAAQVYGLKVLHSSVQDSSENATRFHVLAPWQVAPTGCDRTAVIFSVPNEAGALVKALFCISLGDVNMSCVHSIPLGAPGKYAHYVEFDCHVQDEAGRGVIARLSTVTRSFHVLGSFPQNTPNTRSL